MSPTPALSPKQINSNIELMFALLEPPPTASSLDPSHHLGVCPPRRA